MHLILDVSNILQTTGILPPDIAGLTLGELIDLVRNSRYRRREAEYVCDGAPWPDTPSSLPPGVSITFSGHGVEADTVIAGRIEDSTAPRQMMVISNDRAVHRHARRHRCRMLRADMFLHHLAADAVLHRPDSPQERPLPAASNEPVLPDTIVEEAVNIEPPELPAHLADRYPARTDDHVPAAGHPGAADDPAGGTDEDTLFVLDMDSIRDDVDTDSALPRDIIDEADTLWDRQDPNDTPPPPDT